MLAIRPTTTTGATSPGEDHLHPFQAGQEQQGRTHHQKYQAYTVTLCTFLFAALAVAPFSTLPAAVPILLQPQTWLYIFGLGFLSTMLAFLLYTKGLSRVEPSPAAIIATLEPVIASLVSLLLFKKRLNGWQYADILLVISAVVLVQERSNKKNGP